jgi:hypothetical protein
LNILEIYDEIEFLVGVKLCYKLILKKTRASRLLVPANCSFGKVYSTNFGLKGQIRLDCLKWKEFRS